VREAHLGRVAGRLNANAATSGQVCAARRFLRQGISNRNYFSSTSKSRIAQLPHFRYQPVDTPEASPTPMLSPIGVRANAATAGVACPLSCCSERGVGLAPMPAVVRSHAASISSAWHPGGVCAPVQRCRQFGEVGLLAKSARQGISNRNYFSSTSKSRNAQLPHFLTVDALPTFRRCPPSLRARPRRHPCVTYWGTCERRHRRRGVSPIMLFGEGTRACPHACCGLLAPSLNGSAWHPGGVCAPPLSEHGLIY
jgi:hypothetical protein